MIPRALRCPFLLLLTASCGGSVSFGGLTKEDAGAIRSPGVSDPGPTGSPVTFCDSGAAERILKTYCASCHDEGPASQAGFDFVLDVGRLTTACTNTKGRFIVPGDPNRSAIYERAANNTMPPPVPYASAQAQLPRPTTADIAIVREWIASCLGPDQGGCAPAPPPDSGALP